MQKPYGSKWRAARIEYLRKHPLCVMCREQSRLVPATVVDHIVPHRIKQATTPEEKAKAFKLFWDRKNWQGLCDHHHNSTKQSIEKGGRYGCDENGFPFDPNSHWNA